MNNPSKTNPLVVIAAVAVTLFSVVGIGTMTGLIPSSLSKTTPTAGPEAPMQAAVSSPAATAAGAAATAAVVAQGGASSSASTSQLAPPVPVADGAAGPAAPAHRTRHKTRDPQAQGPAGAPTMVAANAPAGAADVPPPPAPVCRNCGQVDAIHAVMEKGQASGLGAIAGGVLGVVVGHQVGHGDGKTAATILGGAGGAYAGNEVEKNMKKTSHYEIKVAMNDGSTRTVAVKSKPQFVVGERVRVVNGVLEHD